MIGQLNIYGKDKVQVAIERLKAFEPPEGYYLAFSGGKDSVVIKALADMAGVKYDAHFMHTSVEHPETIYFTRKYHPDVIIEYPRYDDGTRITMWNLIPKKLYPPTRIARYCCEALKETGGKGRMTITGVRWDESVNRKNNQGEITLMKPKKAIKEELVESRNFTPTKRGGVVLNNDNVDSRRMIEQCYKMTKTVLNPIIDWTDAEVWEFIHEYDIPYCKLYDEGVKRIGCVGCPMGDNGKQLEQFPAFKKLYIKAFDRMLVEMKEKGIQTRQNWETGEDVYKWWVGTH